MGYIENLGRSQKLGRLQLVAAQLLYGALDGAAILGILVLHDGHWNAIDQEHNVGTIALARWGLDLPLPGDVKIIRACVLEVDHGYSAVALLRFVVPLTLAAEPGQQLSIAIDACR